MAQASPIPLTAQQLLVRAALLGMLKASPVVDRFCGWLLAVGGIVLGFLLGNLDAMQPYLSIGAIRRLVWVLLVAFVLGFVEKLAASMVEAGIATAEETESAVSHLLKGEVEVVEAPFSVQATISELQKCLWYPMKWLAGLGAQKGASDPIWGLKYAARILQIQFYFAVCEVICFVVAAVVVAWGIG